MSAKRAVRKIVQIDEEKCTGCGQCVPNCAEGALQIVGGKARLVKDIYCDGLGACLGTCPEGAITILEREAEAFDEKAAQSHAKQQPPAAPAPKPHAQKDRLPCGCPGTAVRQLKPAQASRDTDACAMGEARPSELRQWPVQITLVPPNAPYLRGADLLLCADCVPFAYADLHRDFLKGRTVLVGCPKLDDAQAYIQKLAAIFREAAPRSVTVLHMEVPCCGGLQYIAEQALEASGMAGRLSLREVTVTLQGAIQE